MENVAAERTRGSRSAVRWGKLTNMVIRRPRGASCNFQDFVFYKPMGRPGDGRHSSGRTTARKINTRNLVWVFLLCFWRILRIEEVIRSDCFERILGHDTNLEDIALMVLYFPH
ncbi:5-hydroxytryptamine receptor 1B [Frankliniella fusca]|uniref:5-hydroxytryptamine receptor 1B n=1 Tax=Frankliniella fusca TaxID=407009 RepID=A0AAE1HIU1_9NEOP|nr:5-hydroxytryptamine receptor 1B [Frankliniella fusca]KAK3921988.1 5-hydroxytryptamine receptor 1B [Frankliniella fusca]